MKEDHITIRRYSPAEDRQWTQEYRVPFPESGEVSVMNVLDYIYRRLVEANMKKDQTVLEDALKHIRTMCDTWKEVMRLNNAV